MKDLEASSVFAIGVLATPGKPLARAPQFSDSGVFLMTAQKQTKNKTSNYAITMSKTKAWRCPLSRSYCTPAHKVGGDTFWRTASSPN